MSVISNERKKTDPAQAAVLGKAVVRAAQRLELSHAYLAQILGINIEKASDLYQGAYRLNRAAKEWDRACLFLRAYTLLEVAVGGDKSAQRWLDSDNRAVNGRPLDLMGTSEGLNRLVAYLEASRP